MQHASLARVLLFGVSVAIRISDPKRTHSLKPPFPFLLFVIPFKFPLFYLSKDQKQRINSKARATKDKAGDYVMEGGGEERRRGS